MVITSCITDLPLMYLVKYDPSQSDRAITSLYGYYAKKIILGKARNSSVTASKEGQCFESKKKGLTQIFKGIVPSVTGTSGVTTKADIKAFDKSSLKVQ